MTAKTAVLAGAAVGLLALVALALAGCANNGVPAPTTTIASLEVGLTAADQVAFNYVILPQCPASGGADGVTCSQAATVKTIKADAQKAHDAIKLAQGIAATGGVPSLTTAATALADLQADFPAAAK